MLIFLYQLQILGPELTRYESNQLEDLMSKVRRKLTTDPNDLSTMSRTYLLVVIELYILGWPPKMSDQTEKFYSNILSARGRLAPMEPSKSLAETIASSPPGKMSAATNSHIFRSPTSPNVESIRQMNLAALISAQMAAASNNQDELLSGGGYSHSSGDYYSNGWGSSSGEVSNWAPKTFSRPPPPISNHQQPPPGMHQRASRQGSYDQPNLLH